MSLTHTTPSSPSGNSRVARAVAGLIILMTLLLTRLTVSSESRASAPTKDTNATSHNTIPMKGDVEQNSKKNQQHPTPASASAAQKLAALPAKLQNARRELQQIIERDYGIYSKDIFTQADGTSRARNLIQEIHPPRFKETLQRKILQGLLAEPSLSKPPQFVWVTGGHSSAAGHGNLVEEAQTVILEQRARPLMEAVGLEWTAKNYAMGGTASASEIAFCSEAIFGKDVDLLAWDYGMTDGRDATRMLLYFYRAALVSSASTIDATTSIPVPPTLLGIHMGGRWEKGRRDILQQLGDMGLTALAMNDTVDSEFDRAMPDTFGLSQADIEQMPRYTRYYKCQGKVEVGEPGCAMDKFNETVCPSRPYKTSWHPGWKWHALSGNSMALWLAEMLQDAVEDLVASSESPTALLAALEAKHAQNYQTFRQSPIPQALIDLLDPSKGFLDPRILFKVPTLCRTGRLPAESRYKGIVTGDGEATLNPPLQNMAWKQVSRDTTPMMPLVTEGEKHSDCPPERFQLDFKHYFLTHSLLNDRHLVLPNELERKEYAISRLRGYVAVCLANCAWGKCPGGDIRMADVINRTAADMRINGEPVTDFMTIMGDCDVLRHANGFQWEADANGAYDLVVSIREAGGYMRFMSVIAW